MFCGKCGTKINEGDIFCTNCGTSICNENIAGNNNEAYDNNNLNYESKKISLKGCYSVKNFSNGVAWIEVSYKHYSLINIFGNEIFNCMYDDVDDYSSHGYTIVKKQDGWLHSGVINKKGDTVVPLDYSYLEFCESNLARGYLNGNDLCYIDLRGKVVLNLKDYKQSWGFHDGLAGVENHSGKWGFINKEGKLVIDFLYDKISTDGFSDGLAWVKKDKNWGAIDKLGDEVIPFEYEYVDSFNHGLASVRKKISDSRNYIIDKSGQIVIYDKKLSIGGFKDGFARVIDGEKEGLMDLRGNIIVPCKYLTIDLFSEGLALVSKDLEFFGFINEKGEEVISTKYLGWLGSFHDGLAPFYIDNQWKYINKYEEIIIE